MKPLQKVGASGVKPDKTVMETHISIDENVQNVLLSLWWRCCREFTVNLLCCPLYRAADQEAELLREHLQSQQHHQPLQLRQPQGAGRQEEEEEELGK